VSNERAVPALGALKSRDLTTWHHIARVDNKSRDVHWTSRDLFQCSSRCSLYKFMFAAGSII